MMGSKHPDADCENCPLIQKPLAATQGPKDAKVALVSRSPGYHEALQGKPFSGPSGKVLDHLLKQNGIERKDILVTNTVLCAPDAGKVPPAAIKACSKRLTTELRDCELVLCAGSEAVGELIGRGSIDRYRGYRIQRGSKVLVATNNPALVLRDDSTFPNLVKDFKRAFNPIPPPKLPKVRVIEDGEEAREYVTALRDAPGLVASDIESRGGLSHKATLVSLQFSVAEDEAVVFGERGGIFNDEQFIADFLRPLLESRDHCFVWHNGKFDVKILRYGYGIVARVDEDTMLMSYDLDERGGVHGLEYLLAEEFGWPDYEPASVKKFKKTGIVENYDELHLYAGYDTAGTYQLFKLYDPQVKERAEKDKSNSYKHLLIEGSEAISQMEVAGFPYNISDAADMYDHEVGPELRRLVLDMRKFLDNPLYNPGSSVQNSALYYDTWKVSHAMQDRPDKKRSCDEAALEEIIGNRYTFPEQKKAKITTDAVDISVGQEKHHRIIEFTEMLMRHRKLSKQASTYIVGMIKRAVNDPDSKIYTDLLIHGTTSGRLSSRNPNLQNITRTKEGLPDVRSLFMASPGRVIVQADYSQAELRCIAEYSGDPTLTKVYKEGLDLHDITAERFFGKNFKKEERQTSKNMNFGMFYRQSAATFREKHGIDEKLAQKYIDWAHTEFPTVWEWEKDVEKEVKAKGYLLSPYGRRRRFHLLTPENIQAVYREAINFYPQTTASDCTLRAVILLCREIDWNRATIVLTVHDSILGNVDTNYVEEYSNVCRQVMESRPKDEIGWTLPFVVDINAGPNWGALV